MIFNDVAATVIEVILLILILIGIVFEKRLVAWEEKHIPKVRSFFAGLGYAFLIWLDKLFDRAAWCMAKVIVKVRRCKNNA